MVRMEVKVPAWVRAKIHRIAGANKNMRGGPVTLGEVVAAAFTEDV